MLETKCRFRMLAVTVLLFNLMDFCHMSIFPGLRRKPLQYQQSATYEVNSDFLTQLMEENARRRLQHQFEQQLELINMQINRQHQRQERQRERYRQQQLAVIRTQQENKYGKNFDDYTDENSVKNELLDNAEEAFDPVSDEYTNADMDFSYRMPPGNKVNLNENFEFAVAPSDARFYGHIKNSSSKLNNNLDMRQYGQIDDKVEDDEVLDAKVLEDYEEYVPKQDKFNFHNPYSKTLDELHLNPTAENSSSGKLTYATNTHRIKPQTQITPPASPIQMPWNNDINRKHESTNVWTSANAPVNSDLTALMEKLHPDKEGFFSSNQNKIVRKHLVEKKRIGAYVANILAGIIAAISVGFVILGIAWYIFRYKSKATADVEYPAYGVIGPKKDMALSADRKLAQSAQMYHYQHQKRQIMAMENRSNNEEGYDMTYVDSDDDIEEADYTVYECPGLAPTGEMEVKNPLFLNDTPITPVLGKHLMAHITTQQPQTKNSNENSSTTSMSSKNKHPTDQ